MKQILLLIALLLSLSRAYGQPEQYMNRWEQAPQYIPNQSSTDAPLMGNGDIGMCVGFEKGLLRYYLTKNDFWRLQSKADHLSGPRVAGYVDIRIIGFEQAGFKATQSLANGRTDVSLQQGDRSIQVSSWVSATENLINITLTATKQPVGIHVKLSAPSNDKAQLEIGEVGGIHYLKRAFTQEVDIPTEVVYALKTTVGGQKATAGNKNTTVGNQEEITLLPGRPVSFHIALESKFKKNNPLAYVQKRVRDMDTAESNRLWEQHTTWWKAYWSKSSFTIGDRVLMKAYYQGLYTMGACARDKRFPPAIFGWATTDHPTWNGDYHLNYNFYAPFYGLYGANRIEQASGQETPLLDFMPRGRWYARQVTKTRGILYPVGIGPLGIEVTRDFPIGEDRGYTESGDVEAGGLFYKQRSHAVFGTVNMAQHWRHTYDVTYGKRIYPYVLAITEFWEDFLVFENGRYQIYQDASNEKSGFNKNPSMSLALVKNAFELAIDLSRELKKDQHRQAKWKNIVSKLADYPIQERRGKVCFRGAEADENGKPVYGASYSHIYPANGITPDSPDTLQAIAKNSVQAIRQWKNHNSTNSFYVAAVRVGYDPATILNELHKYALDTYPNGFQWDNPHGIENSCTVANALQEMACMSVGHKIRLFSVWPKGVDASFKQIRTWGAFLISASIRKDEVSDVLIQSEKGRPCTVINPWPDRTVLLIRKGKPDRKLTGKELTFPTSVNETIWLKPLSSE